MAGDQLQLRGGSATDCDAFTPAPREVVVDTTNWNLRLGDGGTQGGRRILTNQSILLQTPLWCGTAGGTANALTLVPSPAVTSLVTGMTFRCLVGSTNTGAVTLAVNGGSANAVKDILGNDLQPGFLTAGMVAEFTWTGSNYRTTRDVPATLQRLAAVTPSASPTYVTFTLPTGYVDFKFQFEGIAPLASGLLFCQLSVDGGANYLIGGTDYTAGWYGSVSPGFGAPANGSSFTASFSILAGGSGGFLAGEFRLTPAVSPLYGTALRGDFNQVFSTGPALAASTFHGNCTNTTRPTTIRFGLAGTTFLNQGKVIMSGIPS